MKAAASVLEIAGSIGPKVRPENAGPLLESKFQVPFLILEKRRLWSGKRDQGRYFFRIAD